MTEQQPRRAPFDRAEHCRQIGARGGAATVARHGIAYMRAIGAIGFRVYAERHHGGNHAAALGGLRKLKPHSFHDRTRDDAELAAIAALRDGTSEIQS